MYRIIDGRATGKTSRLMLLAKDTNSVIACANPYAFEQKAKAYGIIGIDFIKFVQYLPKSPRCLPIPPQGRINQDVLINIFAEYLLIKLLIQ